MKDFFGLAGKIAMVVGGGQGIGESGARHLAEAGCDVAVVDLDPLRAEAVAEIVRSLGRRAASIPADILDDAQVAALCDRTEAALGGLDILVCVVGASKFGGILELSADEWDRDHARNLRYFFLCTQAAARSFIRRKVDGRIVGIATGGAFGSMPFRSPYGAAKAGLIHFVKSMAVELGEYGIRVNAVAPGPTVTPRVADRMATSAWTSEIGKIPLQRLGNVDDIGKAVLFMASDMAAHVTGATLPVDGGSTIAPNYDLGPSRAAARRNRASLGVDIGED